MKQLKPGTKVRFFSMAGPCLPATVIRYNRTSYTLDFYGNKVRKDHTLVHDAPCPSCQDHEKTQYPDGYMD
jgi:hypothetical protein